MDKNKKKKIYIGLLIILAVALLLQLLVEGPHEPGLYILLGFAGAWALILLSKKILGPLLQKEEDYYHEDGGEDHA